MKLRLIAIELIAIGLGAWPSHSYGQEQTKVQELSPPLEKQEVPSKVWLAHILRQKKSGPTIPFLNFKTQKVPVTLVPKNGTLQAMISLEGLLERVGWSLSLEPRVQLLEEKGRRDFSIHLFITSRINEFTLIVKNSKGEELKEKVFVFAPEANEYLQVSPWNSVMLSAGVAGLGYYQTDFGVYRALVTLLSLRYAPLEGESPWSWGAQLDMTLQTLNSTPVRRSPQLIEAKLSGAFRLDPHFDARLSEQILFGINYLTMLSNDSPFGFSNLLAPELGWRSRWKHNNANYFVGDFRFLALSSNFLKYRGFEVGGAWNRTLQNLHNIELGFSYSGFVYQADSKIEVRSDLLSLKIGYSL